MARSAPRTRLEQHVQLAHLSIPEFVTRFQAVATECGEDKTHVSERRVKRWLAGEADLPRPVCRRILEHWWREPVSRLLGAPENGAVAPVVAMTEEELIVNAGRESMEHAINAAAALDPSALEHLHSAARQAASVFYRTPPLAMFTDLVHLRNIVYQQLDRTHRPRQQAELYLVAGQVCGLLSAACFNLGRLAAAEEQARAAHTYGNLIDNPTLCAWAREHQVHIMYWTGRPRHAASLAASLLETAPAGITRDQTRHTIQAGSSFLALGDGEQAEAQTTAALQLLSAVPEQDRWMDGDLAARTDLATARTLQGDLAGAGDALAPVFAVGPELHTECVVRRLANLGRLLGVTRYRNAQEAAHLGEAIEDFTSRGFPLSTTRTIVNPAE